MQLLSLFITLFCFERSKIKYMSGSNSSQSGLGLSDLSDIGMSTLGGINPIVGNIYAGVKNAQATKQKQQAIGDYEANVESHYNKIFNQNFLDTNLATSVLTRAYDEMKNCALQLGLPCTI